MLINGWHSNMNSIMKNSKMLLPISQVTEIDCESPPVLYSSLNLKLL
jgi:hypothetical protein